ncbi:hypothetical protein [Novosphingobium sp. 9U]|uniref:hypothetical protein n=1 Tax=Novosphingobium sp. 9U TaxID=2653158 RepID=UPI0012F2E4D8|nr:hypothetical protein [Novosphingobium sp. 9U]VWX48938.1 conserved exported hypothetical protein [Novosphingobium sp. 9U]
MLRKLLIALAALPLIGAANPRTDPLDAIARDYVKLTLEAGEREPEYVDAYYGPSAWAADAKAHPRTVPQLIAAAHALRLRAEAIPAARLTAMTRPRRAFLVGQLKAAETRLAMHEGHKFSFDEEARGLFGLAPDLKPLSAYDPVLARIAALVPGDAPLWKRVDDYRNRFMIPTDKVEPVMRAAIAECRKRTVAHIPLPADETFTFELVKNKPWGGYNYYKGNDTSLIQVNTDLPVAIDRAVDLGCHEGYPGHHVYNVLLERNLARGRGWSEFTVYPLYSPQSFLAEGSANFGIELAFPGSERAAFEKAVLFPIAGFDPGQAARYDALGEAMQALAGARFTIARDYLDGRITRQQAIALTQKYSLVSEARALKSLDFDDHYRSYVINYGLGLDMVRAHVNGAGPSAEARWREMARILSGPTVPADLTTKGG